MDEASYWMELIVESGIFGEDRMNEIMEEADELTAILVTCVKNAKARNKVGK